MSISFACTQCGKRYTVKDELAGKKAKCECGNQLLVPAPQNAPSSNVSSLFEDLASLEKDAATTRPLPNLRPAPSAPRDAPASPKRAAPLDRGANVRRNLRRWWRVLLALNVGWFLLTVAVCIGFISYAHANHFSEKRVQMLGQGCGTAMAVVLGVLWLTILLIAHQRKSP